MSRVPAATCHAGAQGRRQLHGDGLHRGPLPRGRGADGAGHEVTVIYTWHSVTLLLRDTWQDHGAVATCELFPVLGQDSGGRSEREAGGRVAATPGE